MLFSIDSCKSTDKTWCINLLIYLSPTDWPLTKSSLILSNSILLTFSYVKFEGQISLNDKEHVNLLLWYYPANIRLDEDVFCLRLQKTSSRRLQEILIKTNINALVIRLQDVFKTSSRRLTKKSWRHLQDAFKTFSRLLKDVSKTSSRHLQDLQRSLQDVFKTYHQVKLFLLTRFQNDFETYSKRFWDVLQRRLSTEGFA